MTNSYKSHDLSVYYKADDGANVVVTTGTVEVYERGPVAPITLTPFQKMLLEREHPELCDMIHKIHPVFARGILENLAEKA